MLAGRTVLLGVTGGIAAYKAAYLASRLTQAGADVYVLMTPAATRLVAPLTFQALTGNPVQTDILAEQRHGGVDHVWLARRADLLVVAPATADSLARLAAGGAGDPVTIAALGVRCPVLICPAMEPHMWSHALTLRNVRTLEEAGYHILPPAAGRMASGEHGVGRLPEPEEILAACAQLLAPRGDPAPARVPVPTHDPASARDPAPRHDLAARRVLVTAGPTREPIDPVRFITNRSSGKMGYALAAAAAARGAEAILVSGPTNLPHPPGVRVVRVESALQMHDAVMTELATGLDAVVGAAAVADYRPAQYQAKKVKKTGGPLALELVRNPDIMATVGARRRPGQVLVGFAAETDNVAANAVAKVQNKHLDFIVANDVTEPGAGFAHETNRATLYYRDGRSEELPLMSKQELADRIWDRVAALWAAPAATPAGASAAASAAGQATAGPDGVATDGAGSNGAADPADGP